MVNRHSPRRQKQRVHIQLQGDFLSVSMDTARAAIMGISPHNVDLLGIAAGSIILKMAVLARGMAALRARL